MQQFPGHQSKWHLQMRLRCVKTAISEAESYDANYDQSYYYYNISEIIGDCPGYY